MRVDGEWFADEYGILRPTVRAHVHGMDGIVERERFLVDTGADRTVFSANFFEQLRLSGDLPPAGLGLLGIAGGAEFVIVRTILELKRDDGRPAIIRGEFAAFTDPDATDLSILGRDVLDNFRLIISRIDDEVLLLAPNHHYRVIRT